MCNHHLAAHMSTFFSTGLLVFDVDTRGAALDEHLGQLHDGGEAAVAGVGVGDDRACRAWIVNDTAMVSYRCSAVDAGPIIGMKSSDISLPECRLLCSLSS